MAATTDEVVLVAALRDITNGNAEASQPMCVGAGSMGRLQAWAYSAPEKARSAAERSKKSSIFTIRPSRIVSRL